MVLQATPDPWEQVRHIDRFNRIQERVWNVQYPRYCRRPGRCSDAKGSAKLYSYKSHPNAPRVQPHQCRLRCSQCAYIIRKDRATKEPRPCGRKTCVSLPFCHQHLKILGLRRKRSNGQRGFGLFAVKPFPQGATICYYVGLLITKQELDRLYPGAHHTADYAMTVGKEIRPGRKQALSLSESESESESDGNDSDWDASAGAGRGGPFWVIDAGCYRGAAGSINEFAANAYERRTNANVRYESLPQQRSIRVVAVRDIEAGEELFGDYGNTYGRAHYA